LGEKIPPNFLGLHVLADSFGVPALGNIELGDLFGDPAIGALGGIGIFASESLMGSTCVSFSFPKSTPKSVSLAAK
jgi:hypothetical protein